MARPNKRRNGHLTAAQRARREARALEPGPQEAQRQQAASRARLARKINHKMIERGRQAGTMSKERGKAIKARFTKKAQLARWEAVHGKGTRADKEEESEKKESGKAAEENEKHSEGDEDEEIEEDDYNGVRVTGKNDDEDDDDQGQPVEQMRPEPLAQEDESINRICAVTE